MSNILKELPKTINKQICVSCDQYIFDAARQEQALWKSGFNVELKYKNEDHQEQTQY